ncbi:hypothetical protein RB600_002805 [Gaeumannomyces tritici]
MKLVQFASAVALLGAGVNASAWWNYKTVAEYEPTSNSIVKHEGTPVGEEIKYEGLTLYVTKPKGKKADKAVLYITDVFGIQLAQNKLLADSFARAGFVTMAPDLFDGVPAPEDLNKPGFNSTAFLAKYNAGVTDPKLATSIKYLREVLGAKVVGGTGYCYGGRYSFRFAAKGKGLDAAFAAHPSLLEDGEIVAATKPAGIAAAVPSAAMPQRASCSRPIFPSRSRSTLAPRTASASAQTCQTPSRSSRRRPPSSRPSGGSTPGCRHQGASVACISITAEWVPVRYKLRRHCPSKLLLLPH